MGPHSILVVQLSCSAVALAVAFLVFLATDQSLSKVSQMCISENGNMAVVIITEKLQFVSA